MNKFHNIIKYWIRFFSRGFQYQYFQLESIFFTFKSQLYKPYDFNKMSALIDIKKLKKD